MVMALTESKNAVTRDVCTKISMGYFTTLEAKQRGYGGFMDAVLSGDYDLALSRADKDNSEILLRMEPTKNQ